MDKTSDEVSPYAEEWLQFEKETGGRFTLTGDVHEMRRQFNGLFENLKPMLPTVDGVLSKDYTSDPGVKVRVYKPVEMRGVTRVGMYIHSGGWSMGSVDAEDHVCKVLCKRIPAGIVSVDYRLAPEHPYPAGLDDCFKVWQWMHTTSIPRFFAPSGLPVPRNLRTFTIGASAGASLALAVALRAVSRSSSTSDGLPFPPPPDAVFAIAPSTIHHKALESVPEKYKHYFRPHLHKDTPNLTREALEKVQDYYTASASPTHPLISVLLHPSLARLSKVYLVATEKDPVADETLMLRDALVEAHTGLTGGGEQQDDAVRLRMYEGYPHCFHFLPQLAKTKVFYDDLVQAIREMCK